MSEEVPEWLPMLARLTRAEEQLGLAGLDFDEYSRRRSQLPADSQRALTEGSEAATKEFADHHFHLLKATVLQWSRDPRIVRLVADPRLKDLSRSERTGQILHMCNHLGEEVRRRSAQGEVVPHAILLGIGVALGWHARSAIARIGVRKHVEGGGRIGREPKIDPHTQAQLWLWRRDGASLNDIVRRLSRGGVAMTKKGVRLAIEREDTKRKARSEN